MDSLFNTIENMKEHPEQFSWLEMPSSFPPDKSAIIYNVILTTLDITNVLKHDKYILTIDGLIKYPVSWLNLRLKT